MQIDELRTWLLSFGDDETLHTELDFQFVLPEPKSFNDQSTQTNDKNSSAIVTAKGDSQGSEFFSASEENEPLRKRLHTDSD